MLVIPQFPIERALEALTGESFHCLYQAVLPTLGDSGQTVFARKDGASISISGAAFNSLPSLPFVHCGVCCVYIGVVQVESHMDVRLYTSNPNHASTACFYYGTRIHHVNSEDAEFLYETFVTNDGTEWLNNPSFSPHFATVAANKECQSPQSESLSDTITDLDDGMSIVLDGDNHISNENVQELNALLAAGEGRNAMRIFGVDLGVAQQNNHSSWQPTLAGSMFFAEQAKDQILLLDHASKTAYFCARLSCLQQPCATWTVIDGHATGDHDFDASQLANMCPNFLTIQKRSPFVSDIMYDQYCNEDQPESYLPFHGFVTCSCNINHTNPGDCNNSDLVVEQNAVVDAAYVGVFDEDDTKTIRSVDLKRSELDETPVARFWFPDLVSLRDAMWCIDACLARPADAEFLQRYESWGVECTPNQESMGAILLAGRYLRLTRIVVNGSEAKIVLQEI